MCVCDVATECIRYTDSEICVFQDFNEIHEEFYVIRHIR